MKIKRPSLKGMKNTKYLGHFAQDKYIQKGHNLSGVFDVYRPPSAIELMAPSNPFNAAEERLRRGQQVGLTPEMLKQQNTSWQEEQRLADEASARIAAVQPEMNRLQEEIQADIEAEKQTSDRGTRRQSLFRRQASERRLKDLRGHVYSNEYGRGIRSTLARKKKFIEEL